MFIVDISFGTRNNCSEVDKLKGDIISPSFSCKIQLYMYQSNVSTGISIIIK